MTEKLDRSGAEALEARNEEDLQKLTLEICDRAARVIDGPAPGYYTVQRDDEDPTACYVPPEGNEVEVVGYIPGKTIAYIFGGQGGWKVLAGPWELPR